MPLEEYQRKRDFTSALTTCSAGHSPRLRAMIERAARDSGTEASRQVVLCARGHTGEAEIRGGRRRVPLGPAGAIAFHFDLELAKILGNAEREIDERIPVRRPFEAVEDGEIGVALLRQR